MSVSKTINPSSASTGQQGVGIIDVQSGGLGDRIGLKNGDRLIEINGHSISDLLDYWFHIAGDTMNLVWQDHAGALKKKKIRKAYDQRLAIELEPFEIRRCNNMCVFCFVHQLPRGMRRELYVKDEDYRLSFLYGNYITGTNLSPADKQRIKDYKLSPLFFSIHATRQDVREDLLVKKNIEPIVPLLADLTEHNIYINGQVVLCPGVNDGEVLRQTVEELAPLYPKVESLAVVPIGLTDHRQRLPQMQDVSPEYAREFVDFVHQLQQSMIQKIGYPFVFPSDEFYLIGDLIPPDYDDYPELPQLGNGVGMYYKFYLGIDELIQGAKSFVTHPRKVAAITTKLGQQVIGRLVSTINDQLKPLHVDTIPVTNSLFGSGITVTGLIPGSDFLKAISEHPGYDRYLIPANALRTWDNRFLDDMTLEELREKTGPHVEIHVGADTAESFIQACLA